MEEELYGGGGGGGVVTLGSEVNMLYHMMEAQPHGSWLTLEMTTIGRDDVCRQRITWSHYWIYLQKNNLLYKINVKQYPRPNSLGVIIKIIEIIIIEIFLLM